MSEMCIHLRGAEDCVLCQREKSLNAKLSEANLKVKNQAEQIKHLLEKIERHEPSSQEKRADALEKKLWEERSKVRALEEELKRVYGAERG